MREAEISYTLTFEPAGTGTRMRWSGLVRPRGAFRLLSPLITWMGRRQEQRIWTSMQHHKEASKGQHASSASCGSGKPEAGA
jgi:hypothetical protein